MQVMQPTKAPLYTCQVDNHPTSQVYSTKQGWYCLKHFAELSKYLTQDKSML